MKRLVDEDRLGCCVIRVDIAFDFVMNSEEEANALMDWIDHHLRLRWRPSRSRKRWIDSAEERRMGRPCRPGRTIYWADKRGRRNLILYNKSRNVLRLEMKFFSTASVRRANLADFQVAVPRSARPIQPSPDSKAPHRAI